jgi:hypothetical protein
MGNTDLSGISIEIRERPGYSTTLAGGGVDLVLAL